MSHFIQLQVGYFDPTFATCLNFLEYGSILQEFSDVTPLSPINVESITEIPAGIPNTISGESHLKLQLEHQILLVMSLHLKLQLEYLVVSLHPKPQLEY